MTNFNPFTAFLTALKVRRKAKRDALAAYVEAVATARDNLSKAEAAHAAAYQIAYGRNAGPRTNAKGRAAYDAWQAHIAADDALNELLNTKGKL